jgi:hypothetical protein
MKLKHSIVVKQKSEAFMYKQFVNMIEVKLQHHNFKFECLPEYCLKNVHTLKFNQLFLAKISMIMQTVNILEQFQ